MKLVKKQDIFAVAEKPTNNCHASTILKCRDGLLAAWFGGTKEKNSDVGILYSKCKNGVWGTPVFLEKNHDEAHWNPVLFRMPDNEIWLFYKIGINCKVWRTYFRVSKDEGESFGDEKELVVGDVFGRGPVKNKPIRLSNGDVLAPASHEKDGLDGEVWNCFTDTTRDCGLTWERTPYLEKTENINVIQPTLWESAEGRVHMLVRTNTSRIYRSDSSDYGNSWCKLYPTALPNNNSGIDCVLNSEGILALVYNPIAKDWGERTPLQVSFSRDNGNSWFETIVLEDAPGEYSYPAIIAQGDRFHITYTGDRQTIVYCEIASF